MDDVIARWGEAPELLLVSARMDKTAPAPEPRLGPWALELVLSISLLRSLKRIKLM